MGVGILVGPRILGAYCLVDGCPLRQLPRGVWVSMISIPPALIPLPTTCQGFQILLFLIFVGPLILKIAKELGGYLI